MTALRQSIRTKIFVSHFILLAAVIGALSFYNYRQALDTLVETTIVTRKASLGALLYEISDAVAGGNYANLQSPRISEEINRQQGLLYLEVSGRSSQSGQPIEAIYNRLVGHMWRSEYPGDYQASMDARISALNEHSDPERVDQGKLDFLMGRIEDAREGFARNQKLNQSFRQDLSVFRGAQESRMDFDRQLLYLDLPLSTGVRGHVEILFDTQAIAAIKGQFVGNALREMLIGCLLALPVLWLLSSHIASPLNKLTSFMRQRHHLQPTAQVPCLRRRDEIGELAMSFSILLDDLMDKNRELENLSRFDPLTGLLNRRGLAERITELKDTHPKMLIGCLYMDIDHFKKYNDSYGHNAGDQALKTLAEVCRISAEKLGGFGFRLGGEELMLLLPLLNIEDGRSIGESLLERVRGLAIKHRQGGDSGLLTLSIGVAVWQAERLHGDNAEMLIAEADNALYRAKHQGRNRVELAATSHQGASFGISWEI
ncbi:GGDEF domain-containing protein [Shewanella sp. GXUN23E]|uniref:GGDEF domain-containing protein n=1 Tax=Shewanella sp. GXUN23E TaxID=3422498 RepID=UPI003D7E9627